MTAHVKKKWFLLSSGEVLAALTATTDGLTPNEAAGRLAAAGANELEQAKPINPFLILVRQFQSLIVWILLAAAIVSAILGEWLDFSAIIFIVFLNAVIGFYQEFNAEQSLAALKKMTSPHAKVKRAKQIVSLPAAQLVTGDVIQLEPGDLVPADARLLKTASLQCVEAALTGESTSVRKVAATLKDPATALGDRFNMAFMGTVVTAGTAEAVVVETGMRTQIGHIAGLIKEAASEEGTPLQRKLDVVGRILIWASLGIVTILFILGLVRGLNFLDLFMISVSLAVAAVPEGLPAVVTVALALGVKRMAQRRALVRRLPSVEAMGSVTVICTDKTGTLTVGEMTVRKLYVAESSYTVTGEGYEPVGEILLNGRPPDTKQAAQVRELGKIFASCNNATLTQEKHNWKVIGDTTEGALLIAASKIGLSRTTIEEQCPRQFELPFNSDRKRASVVRIMASDRQVAFVNGAPDVLLGLCTQIYSATGVRPITDEDRQTILAETSAMAMQALRVLASAHRELGISDLQDHDVETIERDLVFVGLAGMYDPPRPESATAVASCLNAGIKVVMITGDHPHTAMAVAREIGIAGPDDEVLPGSELNNLSDDELSRRVSKIAVYARVTAEHKLRIVRAWKSQEAVVAMTGDGVNDAPAIKAADIGIAMGAGTEVTKQAADIVIMDDNFASIVAAVEEGRGIYNNIRKTLQYLLSGNTGELLLMAACILGGLPVPLLAIHLLWINLVTDGLPALCLATDPIDADVMKKRPIRQSDRIMDKDFFGLMLLTGLLTAGVSFAVYLYELKSGGIEMARTHAFAALVFAELLRSFGCRSDTKPVWQIGLMSNLKLVVVVLVSFALQIFSHHIPILAAIMKTTTMSWSDCLVLLSVSLIPLAVLETIKLFRQHQTKQLVKDLPA